MKVSFHGGNMAHILEGINKDSTFTASDVIEEQITSLMGEIWVYMNSSMADIDEKKIFENWRTDLIFIRTAVHDVLKEKI
jgi:hypothetical protein